MVTLRIKRSYTIYGKIEQVLKIEKDHIRKVMTECKKDGTKLINRAGTEEKPVVVVIDNEIKRWDRKLVIETERHPPANNPDRFTYVIKSQPLTKHLGRNGRRVRSVDKQKLIDLKVKGIAIMCMVSEDKVKEVLK